MPRKPQQKPTFKLFRSTSPNASSPYSGSVLLDGKWYAIEAWMVEPNENCKLKHFEGVVGTGQALARQMVRSAKEPAPADLLTALGDESPDDIDKLREAIP